MSTPDEASPNESNQWLDRLAETLGDSSITREELGGVLRLARDVAHRVERKLAPLSAFLLGASVARRVAQGVPRERAFAEALESARGLLPEEGSGG